MASSFILEVGLLLIVLLPFATALPYVVRYLQDPKDFRKFPVQNWLSGFHPFARSLEIAAHDDGVHHHSRRLYERHRDSNERIVRIGPNWLSFGRAAAIKDIYGYNSHVRKSDEYDTLSAGGAHLNNISEKAVHRERRRFVASYYAPKNIEYWESGLRITMARLLDRMDKGHIDNWASPTTTLQIPYPSFDVVHWAKTFCFEGICWIGLSKDTHSIERGGDFIEITDDDGTKREVSAIESFHAIARKAAILIWDNRNLSRWIWWLSLLSRSWARELKRGADWHQVCHLLATERVERFRNGEELNDLFQGMLATRNGEDPQISMIDRVAEVEQAVGAGVDGPSGAIAVTMYHLIKQPAKLHKLRAELDAVLDPDDRVAPWSKIKGLPYLNACVDEALRIAPPIATDLVRKTPQEGMIIDGVFVPGNTKVSVSAWAAHRDPEYFVNPESYEPERWLAKGDERLRRMLTAFIPFSAGTRGCIGRNVSIVLEFIFIATLIHRYDFSLPSTEWEMRYEEWFNLWPMQLPTRFIRRDSVRS